MWPSWKQDHPTNKRVQSNLQQTPFPRGAVLVDLWGGVSRQGAFFTMWSLLCKSSRQAGGPRLQEALLVHQDWPGFWLEAMWCCTHGR